LTPVRQSGVPAITAYSASGATRNRALRDAEWRKGSIHPANAARPTTAATPPPIHKSHFIARPFHDPTQVSRAIHFYLRIRKQLQTARRFAACAHPARESMAAQQGSHRLRLRRAFTHRPDDRECWPDGR